MNIDVKTLSKILTKQIQLCIKKIIHHHLVGFAPGMLIWFHMRKVINVIHHINGLKEAEKSIG